VALGLYVATLAPGLTWAHDSADGGELAAAAWTLGIPHPPGYPTYVLLAHLLTRLPIGVVATRTNLFSALCAAAAATLVAWALARTGRGWAAAVGAGVALASAPLLWSQATVTEVHTLNGLFTASLLALAAGGATAWRPLIAGLVWGVSMGNHPTAFFSLPLVFLSVRRVRRGWALGAAGAVTGLAVYLYLPLRAAAAPPINWGDPQTLDRFWWVVSGAPYRQFLFALPWKYLPARLLAWAGLLARQFTPVGLAVAILGAVVLWETDRPRLAASGATVGLCSLFALGYDTSDSYLYLIPALICLGLWLGVGMDRLLTSAFAWRRWAGWAVAVSLVALPLVVALLRLPAQDLSEERAAETFGVNALTQAPSGAVIVSQQDAHTFALWYFQQAEGLRPDVVVVDLGLLGYAWYDAWLSQRLAGVPSPGSILAAGEQDLRAVAAALGRPVCWVRPTGAGLSCVEP